MPCQSHELLLCVLFVSTSSCQLHDSPLQISKWRLLQTRLMISTELQRVAVYIDQLDARPLPPLILEPFLVESDCYGHAVVAFAIGVHVAHLECAEPDPLAFHSRD